METGKAAHVRMAFLFFAVAPCAACGDDDAGSDGGTDADTDTDSDTDTDADGDAGADAGDECNDGVWEDSFDEGLCSDMSGWSACVVFARPDAAEGGDGMTWGTALGDLQAALDTARCGAATTSLCAAWQVWAAAGSYYVFDQCPEDTIWLRSDVELYGGFAGTETSLEERDPAANETILDGADGPGGEDHANYLLSASAVDGSAVDGFTITGSVPCADGAHGGTGMLIESSAVSIRDCLFAGNEGVSGSGIYTDASSVEITNSNFVGNTAFGPSTISASMSSEVTITGCVFQGNQSTDGNMAGAIQIWESSAQIVDSTFTGNSGGWGGGLEISSSTVEVSGCTFSGNSANVAGGALQAQEGSTLNMTDCSFVNNTAASGGGAALYDVGSAFILETSFTGNSSTGNGGGLYVLGISSAVVASSLLADNSSSGGAGGGVYLASATALSTFVGCTLVGNTASSGGGAGGVAGTLNVADSILWGNGDEPIRLYSGATAAVAFSDVEGGYAGDGNVSVDPSFTDLASRDLHLQAGSPCIDTGSTAMLPADPLDLDSDGDTTESIPYDLDGAPRIDGASVDMGAYEVQSKKEIEK